MKRVIIDIDDNYASVLSVTATGEKHGRINVTVCAIDLNKCDHMVIDCNGNIKQLNRFGGEAENND